MSRTDRIAGRRAITSLLLALTILTVLDAPVASARSNPRRRQPAPPGRVRPALVASGASARARVAGELDSTGWAWRAAGVTVRLGHHPQRCCHWGVYDFRDRTMWVGPGAFATEARLRYVTLHELAHGWQFASGHLQDIMRDMGAWGRSGTAALEVQADCVAALWGAGRGHYWNCPPGARALAARRLAGDWG